MEGRAGLHGCPALERLIALTAERFAEDHWGLRPLLSRGDELPRGFDDLLTLEAADEILSRRGLRTPFIRVAKDGAIVDASRFTGPGGVGASVGDQVADERILDLFAAGHTVVLQALHRFWPPLIEFAGALDAELGHPVQVNAYITPRESRGFAAHYDVHDVFVIQIAGSKRWIVHEPVHPDPLGNQPWTDHRGAVEARASEAALDDSVLERGDVLYLPRGFIHSAEALGGTSAHLTIGIHNHTRHDLARTLIELAADQPLIRRTLPLGVDVGDPAQLAHDLAVTLEALAETLRSIPDADVAHVLERRALGSSRPNPLQPLRQARLIDELDAQTVVRKRGRRRTTLRLDTAGATVGYAGGSVTFPASSCAAVAALLEAEDGIRVGALPGLTEEDALQLVGRLMRAGILVADAQAPPAAR